MGPFLSLHFRWVSVPQAGSLDVSSLMHLRLLTTMGGTLVHHHRLGKALAAGKMLAVLGVVGILMLGVSIPRADAGIGGSNTPTWPVTVTVGVTFNANVIIINQSTNPNDTENVLLTSLFVTPRSEE